MFIPEPAQKKTEKDLNELLNTRQDGRFKMRVKTAENSMIAEWTIKILFNNQKNSEGIILALKT